MNKIKQRLFTTALIIGPIIGIYSSPIPGINMFELIMILVLMFILASSGIRISLNNNIGLYFVVLLLTYFLQSLISLFLGFVSGWPLSFNDFLYRFIRWFFYIYILYNSKNLFYMDLGVCLIKYLTLFVCILLFIQILWYNIFSDILTFKIPGWPLSGGFSSIEKQQSLATRHVFRAYSVFLEPAHFSYFVVVGLMVCLFVEKKTNYFIALIFTMALFLSTSSAGIFLSFFIWLYFIYQKYKNLHINPKAILFIILFLIISYLAFQFSETQFGIRKVIAGNGSLIESSRTTGFREFTSLLTPTQSLFGLSLGNEGYFFATKYGYSTIYMNTIGYLITNMGYIGLFIFTIVIGLYFLKTPSRYKIFVLVFILTNTFSAMLFSSNMIQFLVWPLVFTHYNKRESLLNHS